MAGSLFEWSDLRIFLAVQRAGSFTAAARELHIDQTTTGRRIASLEAVLGSRLFRRGREGLSLTAAGRDVLGFAQRMEQEALALDHAVRARDQSAYGPVRLTTTEAFGARFLAPRMGELRERHPGILLDLHTDNRSLSLSRREADLAVRLARPAQDGLITRRIGKVAYAVYAARASVSERGQPGPDALEGQELIGFNEDLSFIPEAAWLQARSERTAAIRSNSLAVIEAAAVAGLGLAVLPCYLGDGQPELVRVIEPPQVVTRELWLVLHAELQGLARIRAVADFVTETVARSEDVLLGRRARPRKAR